MIVFLVDKVSARWEYTFDFIFGLRGIPFGLTEDVDQFEKSTFDKIKIPTTFGVLLNDTGITQKEIKSSVWEGQTCVSFDGEADVLSSLFYVITRMEEYDFVGGDKHERFEGKNSWQHKNNCLQQVVCDRWAMAFIQWVEAKIEKEIHPQTKPTQMIPTFDIDNAFAYRFKTGKRKLLSIIKDVTSGNFNRIKERKAVLKQEKKDPYDGYDKILEIAKYLPVRLFWLVGDYGKPDYNISVEEQGIQKLITVLRSDAKIGIHPSYRSNKELHLLNEETHRLEKVLGEKINISRQHFLRLHFPATYQGLIKEGIQEDYTMGFADELGFRNGTAHAFPWFDLTKNEKTELLIRPFAYMDGTLNEYLKLNQIEAKSEITQLFEEVKQFGGDFIFLWHNETITDHGIWKGWSEVLDFTLSLKSTRKI